MIDVYYVPIEKIKTVEWKGDAKTFDIELFNLGQDHDEFIISNPAFPNFKFNKDAILPLINSSRCVVWKYQDLWVAKYFRKDWINEQKYWEVDLELELEWEYNPDIDIKFNNPNITDLYDLNYKMTWYLDPKFTDGDKNWIIKCHLKNSITIGEKDMGYITPDIHVRITYNTDLPELKYPTDFNIAWHDFKYECVWYLDPKFTSNSDKVWAVKAKTRGGGIKPLKDMGYITPNVHIRVIRNPDIPDIEYNKSFNIAYNDFKYECVWYLDPKFTSNSDKVWAVKVKLRGGNKKPSKDMGSVSPKIVYNPALPDLEYKILENIPYYDLAYEHVWMVDNNLSNGIKDVWAAKITPVNSKGTKVVGNIKVNLPERLDVVFISYNEANAEENWHRVLEKASYAKRVNGVKGIVNAHKCAAELATTDMFYVVDGDAYLNNDWSFEYQPGIFDRDCVHVWRSLNPINGLEYGYGGVKLLPRQLTLDVNPDCVDMTTNISSKFKIIPEVSNITAFDTDEFNTFRSAFRECVKLSSGILKRQLDRESSKRLNVWRTEGADKPHGKYAIAGALAGHKFGKENAGDLYTLSKINDDDFIKKTFNNIVSKKF